MTYTDDDGRVVELMKDFDERLSNLEEKSRTSSNPNLLRTLRDRASVGDRVEAVTTKQVETARWGADSGGYRTAAWGQYE